MIKLLRSIGNRFKKYLIVFILIPIITALLGFFVAEKNDVQNVGGDMANTAVAEIKLGSYEYEPLNNADNVMNLISSTSFLNTLVQNYGLEADLDLIHSNLEIEKITDNQIGLSYLGVNSEEAKNTLNIVIDGIMDMSQKKYKEKIELAKGTIASLEGANIGPEQVVDKEMFLYGLNEQLISWSDAEIIEPPMLEGDTMGHAVSVTPFDDPVKRGILGFFIGVMLVAVFIVTPEIFKTENNSAIER